MKEWNSQASGTGDAPPPTEPRRWRPLLRRFTCLLLCFCMLLTVMPCSALAAKVNEGKHPFADVSADSWYNDAVQYVYEHGIFSGTGPTTFTPEGTMTRGMFVTVLGRMAGVDTTAYAGQSAFRDVSPSAYYAPYVAWAAKHGVTSGTSKNTFSPDALINRQEMAAFFVRYFEAFSVEYDAPEHITTLPADLDKVSDWAKESVLTMWKTGLLVGDGTNFNPMSNATRAQAATLCMRIHKAVKTWFKEPGVPSTDSSGSSSSSSGSSTRYYEVKFAPGFAAGTDQDTTGLKLPDTATFRSGTKISELSTPYQAGKVFLGWYYDQGLTKRAETGDVVNKNMTLYAKMMDVDNAAVEETPNYLTKTEVDANEFVFYVKAGSVEAVKAALTVTQITANNTVLDWKTTDDADGLSIEQEGKYFKVTGTYQGGQTYQAKLDESSDAVFYVDGQEQPESVRELNFITAKKDVMNLHLQNGLVYVPKDDVTYEEGTPLEGLFIADAMNTEDGTIKSVENNGSFTYNGDQELKKGDTVAIYEGEQPDKRGLATALATEDTKNKDTIIYVTVTNVNDNTISYTTADTDDVLFTPDVLPVSTSNRSTNGTVILSGDALNFSRYGVPGLDSNTTIDVGDYIAFYSGDFTQETTAEPDYACITSVVQNGDSSYTIKYNGVTEDEMMAAMDLYSTHTKKIELTDKEKQQVESEIAQQVEESDYAVMAIENLSLMAMEADDMDELTAALNDLEGVNYSLSVSSAKNANDTKSASSSSVLDALKDLKKNTNWEKELSSSATINAEVLPYTKTHFKEEGCIGVKVSFEYETKIPLNEDESNELTISVQAEFEQDVMISVNTSGGAVWKKKWIFPYIADYQLNANLDVGTYTGISTSLTVNTGEADDEEDEDDEDDENADDADGEDKDDEDDEDDDDKLTFLGVDLSFLWDDPDEDDDENDENDDIIGVYAERLGEKIDEIVGDVGDFLGDDDDDDDGDMLSSMREQYAEMVEEADDAWIKLVDKEIFSLEGSVDPLHILVYGVSANFVIKANAYATLGATFEYGNAKRYNFSVLVSEKKTTSEVLDLETPNCQFVFYLMGTMGLRAGVELELAVGLCSLKLDSVGISAEAGAYATACGFFYYKWLWEAGTGTDSVNAGAFHSEIGAYVEVKFNAQLFNSDSLTYEKQLYENQWPLLTLGDRENVYSFNYMLGEDVEDDAEGPTYEVESATTLALPTSLFDMAYMDLQSGELFGEDADDKKENPAKNYYKDEDTKDVIVNDHFDISLSNNKFKYDPKTNTITITPDGSVEETCEMTLTWRGNSVVFSSKPISMTVTIEWSDLENARYIAFDSQGGSVVNAIAKTAGASITAPPAPTKTGYTFAGWYEDADYTKAFTMPTTMPDYSNEDKGITVYAKWIPSTTSYKVEYYEQELNGTYTLENTVTETGTTDETVPTSITTTTKDGFTLNTKKSTTDQTIAANGSTVVKLYYDRAKYKLTFAYGVDGLANLESQVKYGAEISAPILHRDGYTFAGWTDKTGTTVTFPDDDENPRTMPAGDVTYTATWTVADTSYKVKHYKQTAVGGSYELCETETIVGTTGQQTNAVAKSYPGYEAQNFEQQSIDGNGSTVVRILYNISGYKITYDGLASDDTTERTNSFTASGTSFKLTPPTKTGYTFENWTCNNNSVTIDADGTITIPTGITENITITANWTQNPVQLLDPNGNEISKLEANTPLGYTVSYTDNETKVADAIVAYWVDQSGKHYYNGDVVEAGVATLKAVLMTAETPMEIKSEAQLTKISENAANTSWMGGNYKLVQPVQLTSAWTGIGTNDTPFTGTFDGSGVDNRYITYGNACHPLFNYASGATIKTLIINGSLTCADQYVGGVVGYAGANCTISDCTVQSGQIVANGNGATYVGGIVGYATGSENTLNSVTISNCIVWDMTLTGSPTAQGCYVGGVAGCLVNGTVDNSSQSYPVYDCTITASSTSGNVWAGGAVGLSCNSNFSEVNLQNGTIQASSAGNVYSGGAVGELVLDKQTAYNISNCMVASGSGTTCTAQTTGNGTAYAAGVVGRLTFSSDSPSQVQISGLVINGSKFTATGTNVVAAKVIGEIQSNGKAHQVSISSNSGVTATAKENSNDNITDNVRKTPTGTTTETGSNNETIITCPATTGN